MPRDPGGKAEEVTETKRVHERRSTLPSRATLDLAAVGVRLRALRGQHINLEMVQSATGITHSLIGYYESGKKAPGAENLMRLAAVYKTSVDYILTGRAILSARMAEPESEWYEKVRPPKRPDTSRSPWRKEVAREFDPISSALRREP